MITESEKEKALRTLAQFESEQSHQVRQCINNDCPTKEFEEGTPNGICFGDGHYLCKVCVNLRPAIQGEQ